MAPLPLFAPPLPRPPVGLAHSPPETSGLGALSGLMVVFSDITGDGAASSSWGPKGFLVPNMTLVPAPLLPSFESPLEADGHGQQALATPSQQGGRLMYLDWNEKHDLC